MLHISWEREMRPRVDQVGRFQELARTTSYAIAEAEEGGRPRRA